MRYYENRAFFDEKYKVMNEVMTEYSEYPTRRIAVYLNKYYPEYFPTVEDARSAVRYRKGTVGKAMRKNLKDKTHVRENIQPAGEL